MAWAGAMQLAAAAIVFNVAVLSLFWANRKFLIYQLERAFHFINGSAKYANNNMWLEGMYEPVDKEVFVQNLEVLGEMPKALDGLFIRTGPNPQMRPLANYHIFDGDGMVHACRIKDGSVSYCNRYVETARLKQEKAAGWPLVNKIGDSKGMSGLFLIMLDEAKKGFLRIYNKRDGHGTGNTALVYHAQKLLTLHEGDLPYHLRSLCNGVIETMGRVDYGGRLKRNFTAHPKVDPETGHLWRLEQSGSGVGEMFHFGYELQKAPFLKYGWTDAKGNLQADMPITRGKDRPTMMHDFAITESYAIFIDCPLMFDPAAMVKKRTIPFVFHPELKTRFGILPRTAKDQQGIRWFEAPAMMMFHVAAAWEDGSLIKLYVCAWDKFDLDFDPSVEAAKEFKPQLQHLREYIFNLDDGTTKERIVTKEVSGDFPVVPRKFVGRKTKYAYLATNGNTYERGMIPHMDGVAKIDLEEQDPKKAVAGVYRFEESWVGGESYFVPASEDPAACNGEDDGYMLTIVSRVPDRESQLLVHSAKSMSAKPIGRAKLPIKIPLGFHCTHVSERQLQSQLPGKQVL